MDHRGGASTPFRAASWAAGGEVGGPRGQTGADVHQARRINLSILAMATAVISSIILISVENVWLLGGGLTIAVLMFVLVFFVPTHLLESPLRHARRVRPGERGRR